MYILMMTVMLDEGLIDSLADAMQNLSTLGRFKMVDTRLAYGPWGWLIMTPAVIHRTG